MPLYIIEKRQLSDFSEKGFVLNNNEIIFSKNSKAPFSGFGKGGFTKDISINKSIDFQESS